MTDTTCCQKQTFQRFIISWTSIIFDTELVIFRNNIYDRQVIFNDLSNEKLSSLKNRMSKMLEVTLPKCKETQEVHLYLCYLSNSYFI